MMETERNQNLRLALEEACRWYRHIDNFFWALSSFLLIGTGFTVSKALEWNGKNWKIVILGFIMLFVWYLYRQFLKDTMEKIQFFLDIINTYEEYIRIDVLPNKMGEIEKKELSSEIFPFANQLKFVKARYFAWIMVYVIYLSWFIWSLFIIEFFVKLALSLLSLLLTILLNPN